MPNLCRVSQRLLLPPASSEPPAFAATAAAGQRSRVSICLKAIANAAGAGGAAIHTTRLPATGAAFALIC
eukprot:1150400-Pelagomonas_calceolata.AAC.2